MSVWSHPMYLYSMVMYEQSNTVATTTATTELSIKQTQV